MAPAHLPDYHMPCTWNASSWQGEVESVTEKQSVGIETICLHACSENFDTFCWF